MASAGGFIGLYATIHQYACPNCGYKMEQRAIYKAPEKCPKCGTLLEEYTDTEIVVSPKRTLIAVAIATVFLIITLLLLTKVICA